MKREARGGQIRLGFRFLRPERKFKTGESLCVNGVCLTAAKKNGRKFEADVIGGTLRSTTLGALRVGDRVNLERPLRAGDPVGGHFVTGHVDGRGKILRLEKRGKNRTLTIQAPPALRPYLAAKGSVAVDGVSLTIQKVRGLKFQAGLVPHTLKATTLGRKRAGALVNLESDLIARYLKILGGIK